MASAVETLIRGVVTKGVMKVAEFNRDHRKAPTTHPYLTGIHEPMDAEVTLDDLQVTGSIPVDLDGRSLQGILQDGSRIRAARAVEVYGIHKETHRIPQASQRRGEAGASRPLTLTLGCHHVTTGRDEGQHERDDHRRAHAG